MDWNRIHALALEQVESTLAGLPPELRGRAVQLPIVFAGIPRAELQAEGIHVRAGSLPGLAEEAPRAYKDVDRVIEVVSQAGIARKVARLRPVAVVKG